MLWPIATLSFFIHQVRSVKVHPMYPLATQVCCEFFARVICNFQPSWQASVPVPIDITYDVPTAIEFDEQPVTLAEMGVKTGFAQTKLENTSFALPPERLIAQAITPEQFSIRLHPPAVCIAY